MSINLHLPAKEEMLRPTITVIGVGGAGGNAVNNMIASNLEGVNFVVANTDAQALDNALTDRTIQLGAGLTKGLGAGATPDVGRAAAEESMEEIAGAIDGSNMVFITAGMGGGTGTGAAPVVARIAKEQGMLTVAVVTKPFQFEGSTRMRLAESGLKELQEYVDTLIIIPNQNLFRIANEKTTFADAFKLADEVLHSGVRGVTDLMVKPGLINLDFADIRAVMREMGKAMMGTGEATGERRAQEAAEAAISNPLLDDVSLKGARALLINITGGLDMTLFEVDEAANRIREEVDPEANIIFGATFNENMEGTMRVSVVATGIDSIAQAGHQPTARPVAAPAADKRPYSFNAPAAPMRAETAKPAVVVRPSFEAAPAKQAAAAPAALQQAASEIPAQQPSFGKQGTARSQVEAPKAEALQSNEIPMSNAQTALGAVSAQEADDVPEEEMAPQLALGEAKPVAAPVEKKAEASISPRNEANREIREAARGERADESFSRHILQKMVGVGRAFSGNSTGGRATATAAVAAPAVEVERSMQVVERPRAEPEKSAKADEEESYLDIPAFLRRQAN